jgi:hypothetical protein
MVSEQVQLELTFAPDTSWFDSTRVQRVESQKGKSLTPLYC